MSSASVIGVLVAHGGEHCQRDGVLVPMPHWDGQVDHIHLLRVEHFVPEPQLTPSELLAENVHERRWWTRDELTDSEATFSPRALPALLEDLLANGVPVKPVALTGF